MNSRDHAPSRPWSPPLQTGRSAFDRFKTVLVTAVVLGLLQGPVRSAVSDRLWDANPDLGSDAEPTIEVFWSDLPTPPAGFEGMPGDRPAAYADADWWPRYASDMDYDLAWPTGLFRPAGYAKLGNGSIYEITRRDGRRITWTAPECDCRRVTLWFYGSSTGLGIGQRDEFTIASQLAKRAWEDGIALDVVNRSSPADAYWLQVNRFGWDLTGGDAPDVALFYVGLSDINAAVWLNDVGLVDSDWAHDELTRSFVESETVTEAVGRFTRPQQQQPPPPGGVKLVEPERSEPLDLEAVGKLAAERVGQSLRSALDLAQHGGTAPFWFWEPSRLSRPIVPGEIINPWDADRRRIERSAVANMPDQIVDLSRSLDEIDKPLFYDWALNEEGAGVVAEAMYSVLEPQLVEVANTER